MAAALSSSSSVVTVVTVVTVVLLLSSAAAGVDGAAFVPSPPARTTVTGNARSAVMGYSGIPFRTSSRTEEEEVNGERRASSMSTTPESERRRSSSADIVASSSVCANTATDDAAASNTTDGIADPIHAQLHQTQGEKREELKRLLLSKADEFRALQQQQQQQQGVMPEGQDDDGADNDEIGGDRTMPTAASYAGATRNKDKRERRYVVGLLRRIVAKISRGATTRMRNTTTNGGGRNDKSMGKGRQQKDGILTRGSFRTATLDVGKLGRDIIDLAQELSELNPTPVPTYGFKGYGIGEEGGGGGGGGQEGQEGEGGEGEGGGDAQAAKDCKLSGQWKLRFTTAADATFPPSPTRGAVTTSQTIDAAEGTFTNVVDFERGKLAGFRVVVRGTPVSETEIDLAFSRVVLLRRSKFPRLLGRLVFPIPRALIRTVSRLVGIVRGGKNKARSSASKTRGPYLAIQYLDDDLRIHKTGDGNWFVQSRLEAE